MILSENDNNGKKSISRLEKKVNIKNRNKRIIMFNESKRETDKKKGSEGMKIQIKRERKREKREKTYHINPLKQ